MKSLSMKKLPAHRLNRRDLLKGAIGFGAMSALGPLAGCASFTSAQSYRIRAENERSGTTDWLLTNTRVDPKTKYRCPWIEGYCSRTSVKAGDRLSMMISTNPPSVSGNRRSRSISRRTG
jgi:hypothetical protein